MKPGTRTSMSAFKFQSMRNSNVDYSVSAHMCPLMDPILHCELVVELGLSERESRLDQLCCSCSIDADKTVLVDFAQSKKGLVRVLLAMNKKVRDNYGDEIKAWKCMSLEDRMNALGGGITKQKRKTIPKNSKPSKNESKSKGKKSNSKSGMLVDMMPWILDAIGNMNKIQLAEIRAALVAEESDSEEEEDASSGSESDSESEQEHKSCKRKRRSNTQIACGLKRNGKPDDGDAMDSSSSSSDSNDSEEDNEELAVPDSMFNGDEDEEDVDICTVEEDGDNEDEPEPEQESSTGDSSDSSEGDKDDSDPDEDENTQVKKSKVCVEPVYVVVEDDEAEQEKKKEVERVPVVAPVSIGSYYHISSVDAARDYLVKLTMMGMNGSDLITHFQLHASSSLRTAIATRLALGHFRSAILAGKDETLTELLSGYISSRIPPLRS